MLFFSKLFQLAKFKFLVVATIKFLKRIQIKNILRDFCLNFNRLNRVVYKGL